MLAAPAIAMAPETDPFEARREPMRLAADLAAIGALEHRWCHANAFARGPEHPLRREDREIQSGAEPLNTPSLLAVAQEQVYDGELPLHEPACLTEAPAIGVAARIAERE